MRLPIAAAAVLMATVAAPCAAQDRFRLAGSVAAQSTSTQFSEEQTFEQYFEQGSFTLSRKIPRALLFDVGGTARVWRDLHAGFTVSIFDSRGEGAIDARVPHPLDFNRLRTTAGEVSNVRRREVGQHITAGWYVRASRNVDVLIFGGPSIFTTEQTFLTALTLTLDKEVFPFDDLAFPGAQLEIRRENVFGYHAGVDMGWRLGRHYGAGVLLRYASGQKTFTPTGGQPVEVEVGGLHAGAGLRLYF